jgi:hypothetical protein
MVVATRPNTSNIHRRFSPHDLGNLALWFAADHISESDGAVISTWSDLSGNGRDATQSSGARPLFQVNRVNGLPAVQFVASGTADYMVISNFAYTLSGLTVFVVAEYDAIPPSAYQPIIGHFDTNSQRAWSIGGTTLTGRMRGKVSTDGNLTNYKYYKSGSAPAASGDFFIGAMVFGSSALSLYVNGVKENTSKGVDGTVDEIHNSTADLTIGAELNGGSVIANSNMNGDIAEIIMYDQKLDDGERTRVERYLSNKYDINVLNPADIPDIKRWYSAEQIPALTNGASVPTWDDWHLEAASTDDDAVQGTSANQPQWKQDRQNGRPSVKFDPDSETELKSMGALLLEGNVTIFVVLLDAAQQAGGSYLKSIVAADADPYQADGTGYGLAYRYSDSPGLRFQLSDGTSGDNAQQTTSNSGLWEVVTARNAATTAILRRDGVQVTTATFSRTSGFVADEYLIGGETRISTRHYTGEIGDLIVYNRALTDKEILVVEAHLAAKYGL